MTTEHRSMGSEGEARSIDGGIVYEDPHVRLSEVLAAIDAVVDGYLWAFWEPSEGEMQRRARTNSIVHRVESLLSGAPEHG
jgi:hypothetical protein